jgi:hypothetical protein
VRGSDSDWYKNVLKTPTIHLAVEAAQLNAIVPPTSDAAKVEQVLDKFRAKYGARGVEAYYPKHDVAVEVPFTWTARHPRRPSVRCCWVIGRCAGC